MGRARRSVTVYEYDEQGRLERSVTQHDPLFLPADVELALQEQALLDAVCPGCGQPREESMNPDNAEAYEVHKVKCFACGARDHARTKLDKPDAPHADDEGLFLVPVLQSD